MDVVHHNLAPWVSTDLAETVLRYGHYCYPIVLLVIFVAGFAAHGIAMSTDQSTGTTTAGVTGPGGKPLPRNIKKQSKKEQGMYL